MGSFATGFLLLGIALVYGATGSFNLADIAESAALDSGLFRSGILLMLAGLAFKVSAAPFHFWTPDVYHGSPSLVTTFMATVVKTAGFAARSEEHTSELTSLMRSSYAVFCLKKKKNETL